MFTPPDPKKKWEYENGFYLTCDIQRISKVIAHYELFKMVHDLPGAIVEFGVYKGVSFARFAAFRSLFENTFSRKLVGFDTFGKVPEAAYAPDKPMQERFKQDEYGISRENLMQVLTAKGVADNVELVEGNILQTLPAYVEKHPEFKVALLNLDTDIYEPSKVILECLWPMLMPGGVLLLDDYTFYPGETKAADDFFKSKNVRIQKLPYAMSPCYVVKE